jgi:hypothetical protein
MAPMRMIAFGIRRGPAAVSTTDLIGLCIGIALFGGLAVHVHRIIRHPQRYRWLRPDVGVHRSAPVDETAHDSS